jgi:transposase
LAILENRQDEISPRMSGLIAGLYEDWICLDERIETITGEIIQVGEKEANCCRLMSVPGVGPLISTAVVAAIGTGEAFERGRDFGAWLGLVPRQYSTGGRSVLGRISKRGSKYLRTLFIQAANVILTLQLRDMAPKRSPTATPQQAGNGPGKQTGADHVEHPAQRETLRRLPSRSDGNLKPYPSSR